MKEIAIKIPSSTEFVGPVVTFFQTLFAEKGFEEAIVSNVTTSLIEAVGNAIVHGNKSDIQKTINISIQVNKNMLQIEVQDEGNGFDIDALPDPLAPENIFEPCGRGIFLIKTFMDDVNFGKNGRGSRLIMRKTFERNIE